MTQTVTISPLLLSADQAAALCGLKRSAWYARIADGTIGPQAIKIGSKSLWRRSELVRWIEAGCPSLASWQAGRASP